MACDIERVTVASAGSGPEASARAARYQIFDQKVGADEVLVLGHHANDQVETVLYRLLRGAGVKGLAGIPAERALLHGQVQRPLLGVPQATLRSYAEEHDLQWIEDESNQRIDYDRNYLRHRVIPALLRRWPDLAASVGRSARHNTEADKLNADLAALDLAQLDPQLARVGRSIAIDSLLSLPDYRQRNVLRYWCVSGENTTSEAHAFPGHRVLDAVFAEVIGAQADAQPVVSWPGGEWRRFRKRLYCLPLGWQSQSPLVVSSDADFDTGLNFDSDSKPADSLLWPELNKPLVLPKGGELRATPHQGQGVLVPPAAAVSVGFRGGEKELGGERCKPAGRSASTTLKKLFQEYDLEPWLRDWVPLIYIDNTLAAVGDLWVCEGFQTSQQETGYQLTWAPASEFL